MSKVLLIVNEIPENLNVYLVDVEMQDIATLKLANGKILNCGELTPEEDKALLNIFVAVAKSEHKKNWVGDVDPRWVKKNWHEFKLDQSKINTLPADCKMIVVSMAL